MIAGIVNLVKDWRNAISLLLILPLVAWIRPDPAGLTALTLIVFACVYLGAAIWTTLRKPRTSAEDRQTPPNGK